MKINHGKNFVLKDKSSTFIDKTVKIGNNVTIYGNNQILGNTIICDNVIIFPNCIIKDSKIEDNSTIIMSDINSGNIGKNCKIGPFSRIRPESLIKDEVSIGNFVEIKNSIIGKGTKINHLAYVGDAKIGEYCNVGCGVIFANYDGKVKHLSSVGDNCFIGSNSNIIAPVKIDDGVYICAGTTVTEDCKSGDFVIGRARQTVKENKANKYLKKSKR